MIKGGAGKDTLAGGGEDDTIWGEVGSDTIRGDEGDDILAGGDGVDQLAGGFGLNSCDYTTKEIKTKTCLYDDDAPKVVSWTYSRSTIDVGQQNNRAFSIDLRVTDATGIQQIYVYCLRPVTIGVDPPGYTPTGYPFANAVTYLFPWVGGKPDPNFQRPSPDYVASGTDRDFTVHVSLEAPYGIPPGKAECWVNTSDVLNHRAGTAKRLTLTRTGAEWDDQSPVVVSKKIPIVTSSHTETTAALEVTWREENSISSFEARCFLSTYPSVNVYRNFPLELASGQNPQVIESGDGQERLYKTTTLFRIPAGQQPGEYHCVFNVADARGKIAQLQLPLTVNRVGTGFVDSYPIVTDSSFSKSVVDTGSSDALTTIQASLRDARPINLVALTCDTGTVSNPLVNGLNTSEVSITAVVTVPFGVAPGKVTCEFLVLDDISRSSHKVFFSVIRTPPGLPQAPDDLHYVATNPTSGVLSWAAPEFPGDPTLRDYQIAYSRDNKSWKTINDGYSTTTSLPVSNLKPNRDYWFKVRGDNGGNSIPGSPGGTWSQVLKMRTPQATVADALTALTTSLVTARSARANWVYGYNGGATITDFVAEVSADNGVTWKTVAHKASTAVTMTISGLLPATHYTLRVRSKNAKGLSNATTTQFTTLDDVPDAAKNLRVTAKDSSSFSLAWDDPVANGAAITDYRVEYSTNNGRTWVNLVHDPFVISSATLSSLRSKATYVVRVTAINSVGVGKVSSAIKVITL